MIRRKAILFLLVAGFCFVGSLPMYWLQTQFARHQMKERMAALVDPSELQTFDFEWVNGHVADAEFAFLEDGKEFSYHGRFFDIFKMEHTNGHVRFWVIPDELEDQLLAKMQADDDQNSPYSGAAKTFLKFFGKSFPNPQVPLFHACSNSKCIVHHAAASWTNVAFDIPSPPPQA